MNEIVEKADTATPNSYAFVEIPLAPKRPYQPPSD